MRLNASSLSPGLTRRSLFGVAAAASAGGGFALGRYRTEDRHHEGEQAIPFHATHQAGVATPPQAALALASFDFVGSSSDELRDLLQTWSRRAAQLTTGRPPAVVAPRTEPPADTGEAHGLGPAGLTLTFGLGPRLFERDPIATNRDRLPAPFRLPAFRGDALENGLSDGDLCIQACANDPQVAFQAIHQLALEARGTAVLRWFQQGFSRASSGSSNAPTPRALIGFKDGTNNLRASDPRAMHQHVWIGSRDGPRWLADGTYMVVRRIRFLFDVWDSTSLRGQEAAIGRHKESGAPLGATAENAPVNLLGENSPIPPDAHIRLAAPASNRGVRLLRRGYSYASGVDPATAGFDAGLIFISFQRRVENFALIQRRLAESDALSKHVLHVGSAVFLLPPGARVGEFVGQGLFD